MDTAAQVIGLIIASAAWLGIFGLPVALLIPASRRWLMRPFTRARAARRQRRQVLAQARRDAKAAVLEQELYEAGLFGP